MGQNGNKLSRKLKWSQNFGQKKAKFLFLFFFCFVLFYLFLFFLFDEFD